MPNNRARRPGRRAGNPDTREAILAAARRRFTDVGYAAASTRAIAADAGVDAALINYFFGSKQNLFGAAFALSTNPAVVIAAAIEGPVDGLARRLLGVLLDTWEVEENRATLLAIARAGAGDTASLTRGFVEGALEIPVRQRLQEAGASEAEATRCSALLTTQLVGVIYTRYVLAVDAAATMPAGDFLDGYVPALEAIIDQCHTADG